MDSALLLRALEDGLRPLVLAAGGTLEVASDPDHVFEMLAVSPRGWRMILSYGGDEAVDEMQSPGIVRWTLNTTVQAARGLAISLGSAGHRPPVSNRDPLLTLADHTSRWIRGLSGTHPDLDQRGFRQTSRNWLTLDGQPNRQILLTHRCLLALEPPLPVFCVF